MPLLIWKTLPLALFILLGQAGWMRTESVDRMADQKTITLTLDAAGVTSSTPRKPKLVIFCDPTHKALIYSAGAALASGAVKLHFDKENAFEATDVLSPSSRSVVLGDKKLIQSVAWHEVLLIEAPLATEGEVIDEFRIGVSGRMLVDACGTDVLMP